MRKSILIIQDSLVKRFNIRHYSGLVFSMLYGSGTLAIRYYIREYAGEG